MGFKTDFSRVAGLGSAKDGTEHWVTQRLSAVALIPLTLGFLYPFASSMGTDIATVHAIYQKPLHAIVAILFFLVTFRHLRLGMQIVFEDYLHGGRLRVGLMIANALIWRAMAVTGIFAVAKIALGA